MKNYLTKFESYEKYQNYINSESAIFPNVSICEDRPGDSYFMQFPRALRFKTLEDSTIEIINKGGNTPNVQYSFDGQHWTDWDYSELSISKNKILYVRGNNPEGFNKMQADYPLKNDEIKAFYSVNYDPDKIDSNGNNEGIYSHFSMTGSISCTGNIMWLLDYENDITKIPCSCCFYCLFGGCSSLVEAPELPAIELSERCYEYMFYECESLIKAPKLPSIDIKPFCYLGMFYGCSSLVKAPELPSTNITGSTACYCLMFNGCANLQKAPNLPAVDFSNSDHCYNGMFMECTSLKKGPELPAIRLNPNGCYNRLFEGCSKLNYIKAMFESTPNEGITMDWTKGVSENGTFVKSNKADWEIFGDDGIPNGWAVKSV